MSRCIFRWLQKTEPCPRHDFIELGDEWNAAASSIFITGLHIGGAEMMLYKLLSGLDRTAFEAHVLSLIDPGPVGPMIERLGVPVHSLGMRRGRPSPSALLRCTRWIRRLRPQVVQTWMHHADLLGGLSAKLAGHVPVVWNIQASDQNHEGFKRSTIRTVKACAMLSSILPIKIVCCSEASYRVHCRAGYDPTHMMVIPNGTDTVRYRPDADAHDEVRAELNLPKEAIVIGLVARFHPQKDHFTFIRAAGLVAPHYPKLHFVLCGDGITMANEQLRRWIEAAGIRDRSHLLGRRSDVPRITAALDIASLTSWCAEGFPNVIGEAMACAVPCVVTDVGDAATIVGRTGRVVPIRDPDALAAAWQELLELDRAGRHALGEAARQRVLDEYNLPNIIARYEAVYREVAWDRPAFPHPSMAVTG